MQLWGSESTIAIIIPCARPADVAESWPRARLQVLPNSGSQMFMLRVKTLSVRDRHWRNPRRRKIIKSTAIWKAHVSVRWRAQCHSKWPLCGRRIQHHAGVEPMSPDYLRPALTTPPLVHITWSKKTVYDSSYSGTIFCSMLIEQLINLGKWKLIVWNLGQIFKIELWMVGQ